MTAFAYFFYLFFYLKLFGNCKARRFLKLEIKFYFTCGKSNLYQSIVRSANVVTIIVSRLTNLFPQSGSVISQSFSISSGQSVSKSVCLRWKHQIHRVILKYQKVQTVKKIIRFYLFQGTQIPKKFQSTDCGRNTILTTLISTTNYMRIKLLPCMLQSYG